jgi:hypothetical protein
MRGPSREFLAGAALAADEDGRFGRSHSRQELEDFLHARAFTHQAAIEGDLFHQALIFLFQPLQTARIFQRHGGDASDSSY